jgi:hypothetical protein
VGQLVFLSLGSFTLGGTASWVSHRFMRTVWLYAAVILLVSFVAVLLGVAPGGDDASVVLMIYTCFSMPSLIAGSVIGSWLRRKSEGQPC